jgi:hypothetical protein
MFVADNRNRAVFLSVRHRASLFNGRALAGVRSRTPVPTDAGLPTLSMCPLTPFGSGGRVAQPVRGGSASCLSTPLALSVPGVSL